MDQANLTPDASLTPDTCYLFTDLNEVKAIECSGYRHKKQTRKNKRQKIMKSTKMVIRTRKVKAQFKPALCYLCRIGADKIDQYGWGYMNEIEAKLISLTRRSGLLREFIIQAKKSLETIDAVNNKMSIKDNEQSSKTQACEEEHDSLKGLDPNSSDVSEFHDSDYPMDNED